jgi:HAD superfamily hydrolase (TIGR01509 family)
VTDSPGGIAAVIFDCDGTLVDSEPLAREAWDRTLAEHGYTASDAEMEGLIGLSYPRVHAHFAGRVPGLPDADAFWPVLSGELFALIDARLEPFADAGETLQALRARGIAVAVASSSARERLERTLRRAGLEDAFDVSVAGDEVEHGKPAPDMFLEAARRLGVEPARCAVVEDSPPGVAAGLAAGMLTVAVARAPGHAAALGDAHRVLERLTAAALLAA